MEDKYLKEFSESFGNEMQTPENPLEKVKAYLMQLYNSDKVQHGNPDLSPTLPGLQGLADKLAGIEEPQPQGYANGGVVDQDFYNQLQQGTAMTPQFDPTAGMPPTPPPMAPPMAVPAPNPLNQYLDTQRTQINKFGPEQQLAVSNDLIKKRQGFGSTAPVALGGFADALMSAGGKQSPGFMQNIQGQQNLLANEKTDALKNADTSNLAHVEAGAKLDAMDPNSPVSKVAQQTWGALLAKNGFKPEQIAQMPASSIAALTGQTVEALKASAEAKMAEATLGLKSQQAKEEARHNIEGEKVSKGNLEAKVLEDKRNALKETASHYVTHPINAFKASGELGKMGLNESATPSTNSDDDKAIAWANANPTDPRAARIKALHGIQ